MRAFHPTAIARSKLSMPMREFLKMKVINKDNFILDYGFGRGQCLKHLRQELQYTGAYGYDPYTACLNNHYTFTKVKEIPKVSFNAVTLIYVLNVIEDIKERRRVLQNAFNYTANYLLIAVRTEPIKGEVKGDGVVTKRKTFQKRYTQEELIQFVHKTLDSSKYEMYVYQPGLILLKRKELWDRFSKRRSTYNV